MSEVKVNKISPSSGTAFTLGDSGDTFTVPSGATIVNSGTATGFGGGKIGQVVQTLMTDGATTTSTSFVTSGFAVAITPTATDSKVLLLVSFGGVSNQWAGRYSNFLIDGGNCATYIGDAGTGIETAMAYRELIDSNDNQSASMMYLDSPATTSATTYTIFFQDQAGGTARINTPQTATSVTANAASTFIAMEILA